MDHDTHASQGARTRWALVWSGRVFFFVLIALLITTPIKYFVAQPFIVSGASMEPTLLPGEYLIIDEISTYFHEFKRGELVIFQYPLDPAVYFVKRIVGLPGETVDMRDGVVWITPENGVPRALEEPYVVAGAAEHAVSKIILTNDEYFVLGDNRSESSDSRKWGPLQSRYITGRVLARLFPLSKAQVYPGQHAFTPLEESAQE